VIEVYDVPDDDQVTPKLIDESPAATRRGAQFAPSAPSSSVRDGLPAKVDAEPQPSEITYTAEPDNCRDVIQFVSNLGDPEMLPVCDTCGGYGEYETNYGPRGCDLCNSRLIRVCDPESDQIFDVDWGDTIVHDGRGHLSVRRGNNS
jgi:hypothetical protein